MKENDKDIEYIVFNDKKIVACRLWECEDLATNRILKYIEMGYTQESRYKINNIYIGIAKCSEEDEFDIEQGKKIALTKARRERDRAINNTIKKYIKDIRNALSRLEIEGIHPLPDLKEIIRNNNNETELK